jgi:glutathione synthase/RimK-type ligase-like ATP-grasp enzyme
VTRVALATCAALPELDDDERRSLPPLRALGIDAEPAIWDDPGVDWPAFDLVVVRNTWDYTDRLTDFLAWARSVPRLANPAPVLAWNTDKRYLADLAGDGLPIVPTRFAAPGETFTAPGFDETAEIVVKPTVSAGSRGAGRFGSGERDAAIAHMERLHAAGATAMIQPYLTAVDDEGETALLYLGGAYSHAIRKAALLRPGASPSDAPYLAEDIAAREPSPAQRALADQVVATVTERFGPLLYARVDLLPGPDGDPLIVEVELTEPSLFLAHDDGAPDRLAAAIAAAARPGTAA